MDKLLTKASSAVQEAEVLEFKEDAVSIRYEAGELKKIQTQ